MSSAPYATARGDGTGRESEENSSHTEIPNRHHETYDDDSTYHRIDQPRAGLGRLLAVRWQTGRAESSQIAATRAGSPARQTKGTRGKRLPIPGCRLRPQPPTARGGAGESAPAEGRSGLRPRKTSEAGPGTT